MLEEVMAAAGVGLSFGNSWLCILLSLGTRAHSKMMAVSFILGRFLGIMAVGLLVGLFGFFLDIPQNVYIGLGILIQQYSWYGRIRSKVWSIWHKALRGGHGKAGGPGKNGLEAGANPRPCAHRHDGSGPMGRGRAAHGGCSEQGQSGEGATACMRSGITTKGGFVFGIVRGATPCFKFLVLVPLVLVMPFPQSLVLVAVFAMASTVYPIIGFLIGNILVNLPLFSNPRKAAFRLSVASSFILCGIGIYYVYKYLTFNCIQDGV